MSDPIPLVCAFGVQRDSGTGFLSAMLAPRAVRAADSLAEALAAGAGAPVVVVVTDPVTAIAARLDGAGARQGACQGVVEGWLDEARDLLAVQRRARRQVSFVDIGLAVGDDPDGVQALRARLGCDGVPDAGAILPPGPPAVRLLVARALLEGCAEARAVADEILSLTVGGRWQIPDAATIGQALDDWQRATAEVAQSHTRIEFELERAVEIGLDRDDLRTRLAGAAEEVTLLRSALQEIEAQSAAERSELEQEGAELRAGIAGQIAEQALLRGQLGTLEEERDGLTRDRDDLHARLAGAAEEVTLLRAVLQEMDAQSAAERSELEQEGAELRAGIAGQIAEQALLRGQLGTLEEERDGLTRDRDDLHTRLAGAAEEVTLLRTALQHWQDRGAAELAEQQDERDLLRQSVADQLEDLALLRPPPAGGTGGGDSTDFIRALDARFATWDAELQRLAVATLDIWRH